jgi:hypothetical protein
MVPTKLVPLGEITLGKLIDFSVYNIRQMGVQNTLFNGAFLAKRWQIQKNFFVERQPWENYLCFCYENWAQECPEN